MASTGFLAPTSGVGTGWTTPTNIYTVDGASATVGLALASSEILFAGGFDFSSIPNTATIDGIEIELTRRNSHPSQMALSDLILYDTATPMSEDKGDNLEFDATMLTITYGSAVDTWAWAGITPADLDATFKIGAVFYCANATARTVYVDAILVNIHYTDSEGGDDGIRPFMLGMV